MKFLFSLHDDDPGDIGYRPRNEIAYSSYTRQQAIERQPGLLVSFPQCQDAGPVTMATYWGVSTDDGELRLAGKLYPPIAVGAGVTPQIMFSGEMADVRRAIAKARQLRGWR